VWNRAKTVLITIILITASLTVYFSMHLKTYAPAPTPSEAERVFSPYEEPIPGQEVSLDQAQASVPFKINLPKNMGTCVELKLLQPPQTEAGAETLYIIYASHKPSSDATFDDVKNQNGIILIENPNVMTLQGSAQNIRDAIDSTKNSPGGGLQEVNINGYVGCAGGNVGHCVNWCTETTEYHLMANIKYPLQQLVEIARSIPVK
jgi:hypothetical protein